MGHMEVICGIRNAAMWVDMPIKGLLVEVQPNGRAVQRIGKGVNNPNRTTPSLLHLATQPEQ